MSCMKNLAIEYHNRKEMQDSLHHSILTELQQYNQNKGGIWTLHDYRLKEDGGIEIALVNHADGYHLYHFDEEGGVTINQFYTYEQAFNLYVRRITPDDMIRAEPGNNDGWHAHITYISHNDDGTPEAALFEEVYFDDDTQKRWMCIWWVHYAQTFWEPEHSELQLQYFNDKAEAVNFFMGVSGIGREAQGKSNG